MSQPIATLQTPHGRGGITVLVLEGAGAEQILARAFRPLPSHAAASDPTAIQLGRLMDGPRVIDEAILCRRGDSWEINIHGGPVAAQAALELLVRLGAQAGAAQAVATGAFPLAHPEWNNPAVGCELLEALPAVASELTLSAISRQWSAGLSELVARTLAGIAAAGKVTPADASALRRCAAGIGPMRRLLDPPQVVLAGPPNAGKSTLANAMIGRAVSIVDPAAGTTRDWVRELAIFHGVPLYLTDTAGLWSGADGIDAQAVARARAAALSADLVILLLGPDQDQPPAPARDWPPGKRVLRVASKCDLGPPRSPCDLAVSAQRGDGLEDLKIAVVRALGLADVDWTAPLALTERQARLLAQAADAIDGEDAGAAQELLVKVLRQSD
ncbi:MAG: GTPase [Phycisphaerae bacterium]|jgi:tRNA modification GTPase